MAASLTRSSGQLCCGCLRQGRNVRVQAGGSPAKQAVFWETLAAAVTSCVATAGPAWAEQTAKVDFGQGGNADPKSYWTVLGLFLLSVPGALIPRSLHPQPCSCYHLQQHTSVQSHPLKCSVAVAKTHIPKLPTEFTHATMLSGAHLSRTMPSLELLGTRSCML